MGMFKKLSSSSFDYRQPQPPRSQNPDPYHYEIIKHAEFRRHLVVMVRYPDCTTYEGKKILLFRNLTMAKLKKQAAIDPHFSENKSMYSPFARFEPTKEGWEVAMQLAEDMT